MKRLRKLLILLFAFFTLSSFTNGNPSTVNQKVDSIYMQFMFENPRILIDDYRDFQAWTNQMRKSTEFDSALIKVLKDAGMSFDQYVESQERRYESAMDYLTRRTNYSMEAIEIMCERKTKSDLVLVVLSAFLLLSAAIIAFRDTSHKSKRLKRSNSWPRQIAIFVVLLIIFLGLVSALYYLLLFTMNSDYHHMLQLLNLSG